MMSAARKWAAAAAVAGVLYVYLCFHLLRVLADQRAGVF
jgi:hypothetical protein